MKPGRCLLVAFLVVVTVAPACSRGGEPAHRAKAFYASLDRGDFAEARAMTTGGEGLKKLRTAFGSLQAWGNRATKNGTLWRTETSKEEISGSKARVQLRVLFNDGTRRNDTVGLVLTEQGWRVDAGSLSGLGR